MTSSDNFKSKGKHWVNLLIKGRAAAAVTARRCLTASCHTVCLSVLGWRLVSPSASSSNKGDVREAGGALKSTQDGSKVLSQPVGKHAWKWMSKQSSVASLQRTVPAHNSYPKTWAAPERNPGPWTPMLKAIQFYQSWCAFWNPILLQSHSHLVMKVKKVVGFNAKIWWTSI